MFNFPAIKQYGLNCVYKITVGDYFYFGSTTCIKNRISSYKNGSYTTKLKKAIKMMILIMDLDHKEIRITN